MKYTNQLELYLSLLPVFKVKNRLTSINNHQTLSNENIWNYLIETKWKHTNNLSISEVVNDIITVEIDKINIYNLRGGTK